MYKPMEYVVNYAKKGAVYGTALAVIGLTLIGCKQAEKPDYESRARQERRMPAPIQDPKGLEDDMENTLENKFKNPEGINSNLDPQPALEQR